MVFDGAQLIKNEIITGILIVLFLSRRALIEQISGVRSAVLITRSIFKLPERL